MKKLISRLTAMALCLCLLCGCTKSTVINPEPPADLPMPSADGLVWDQLWQDWTLAYEDQSMYPFILSVNANIDSDEGVARFFLLTETEISEEEAADFAMEAIKGFANLINMQNMDYAAPSDTSFGGYLSQYDIYVMVGQDEYKSDESSWILEDTIPAGEYREFQNSRAE